MLYLIIIVFFIAIILKNRVNTHQPYSYIKKIIELSFNSITNQDENFNIIKIKNQNTTNIEINPIQFQLVRDMYHVFDIHIENDNEFIYQVALLLVM